MHAIDIAMVVTWLAMVLAAGIVVYRVAFLRRTTWRSRMQRAVQTGVCILVLLAVFLAVGVVWCEYAMRRGIQSQRETWARYRIAEQTESWGPLTVMYSAQAFGKNPEGVEVFREGMSHRVTREDLTIGWRPWLGSMVLGAALWPAMWFWRRFVREGVNELPRTE